MSQALLAGLLAAAAGLVAAVVAAWMYGMARATGKRAEAQPRRRRDLLGQYAALIGLLLSVLLVGAGIVVGVVQTAPGPTWARWLVAGLLTAIAVPVVLALTARLADRAEDVRLRRIPAARPELAGRDTPSRRDPRREPGWGQGDYDESHATGGWRVGEPDPSQRTGGWPAFPGPEAQRGWQGGQEPAEQSGGWPGERAGGWPGEQTGGWSGEDFDEPPTAFIPPRQAPVVVEQPAGGEVVPAMTYVPYGDADDDLVEDAPDTSPVEDAETLVREVQPGLVYRDAAGSWFLGVADPYGVPRPLLRLPGFSATTAHEPVYPLDVMGSVEIAVLPLDQDGEEDGEARATAGLER